MGFIASSRMSRLRAFFDKNPDECLTYSDIAIKLDCTMEQAYRATQGLMQAGEVMILPVQIVRGPCLRKVDE